MQNEINDITQDIPVDNEIDEKITDNLAENEIQEDLQDTIIDEAVDQNENKINNDKEIPEEKNQKLVVENEVDIKEDEENSVDKGVTEDKGITEDKDIGIDKGIAMDKEVITDNNKLDQKEIKEVLENKETQDKVDKNIHNNDHEKSNMDSSEKVELQKNKAIFILSYLGILFFLPLIVCPESKVGRFHANQGLVLFITSVASQIIHIILQSLLPLSFWGFLSFLFSMVGIALFVLMIIGMINASKGEQKSLPIIGSIQIIK